MKVYMYYLALPDDLTDYPVDDVSRFEMVAPQYVKHDGMHDDESGKSVSLYAYTTDKALAYEFGEMHDDKLFTLICRKMDKDDYESLLKEFSERELIAIPSVEYRYRETEASTPKDMHIVMTRAEDDIMNDEITAMVEQEICEYASFNYSILKTKYIAALDYLLYCTYYRMMWDDPDTYSYNFGFGSTAEGYPSHPVSANMQKYSLYFTFFKLLLRKD